MSFHTFRVSSACDLSSSRLASLNLSFEDELLFTKNG